MSTFHDYESYGLVNFRQAEPEPLPDNIMRLNAGKVGLVEQWSGTQIVEWWHKIYDQLIRHEQEADKARNFSYVDKIRSFRDIWQRNKVDGSINVEPLNALFSAAKVLGDDSWNLASYFRTLASKLDVVIQSENQLPRGMDANQGDPMAGTGGGGRGGPPMAPSFGPEEDAPPGAEGGEGGMGGGGGGMMPATGPDAGQGGPGAEGEPPYPEGGTPGEEGAPPPDETMPPSANAEPPTQTGAMGDEAEKPEPKEAPEDFGRI